MARLAIGAGSVLIALSLGACGTTVDLTQSAKPVSKPVAHASATNLSTAQQFFRSSGESLSDPLWSEAAASDTWMASMTNILVHGMGSEAAEAPVKSQPELFVQELAERKGSGDAVLAELTKDLAGRNALLRQFVNSADTVVGFYQAGELGRVQTVAARPRTTLQAPVSVADLLSDQGLVDDISSELADETSVFANVVGAFKKQYPKSNADALERQIAQYEYQLEQLGGVSKAFAAVLENSATEVASLDN